MFIGSAIIDAHISLGISLFNLCEIIQNTAEYDNIALQEFLKCIADKSKMAILQMLKGGPMYAGQLAERLDLTGATISHHMSVLHNLNLVTAQKESTKVYFSLNKKVIEQLMNETRDMMI